MTTRLIPMSIIHVDDSINVSRGGVAIRESPSVLSLADDIKVNGLIENVGVVPLVGARWLNTDERSLLALKGFEFVLVYGFRRFKACSLIGFVEIRCEDLGNATRAEAELENLAENCGREPPTDYHLTLACHRCMNVHKLDKATIARRLNRSAKWVADSIAIVSLVAPDMMQFYAANCSAPIRRKMIQLAALASGETDDVRFETQRATWKQWEMSEAEASGRGTNPEADFSNKRGNGNVNGRRHESNVPNRTQLIGVAEAIIVANEYYDGHTWRPMTPEVLNALRSMARWTLNPREMVPVR